MPAKNTTVSLRPWTRELLTHDDIAFAVSDHIEAWDSLSHRLWNADRKAAKRVVVDMLDWECLREFENNTCPPFLSITKNQERIKSVLDKSTLLKPSEIEPLKAVALENAPQRNLELSQGIVTGRSVHAFEIDRDEETETTVQRFKNWLTRFKQSPDKRWSAGLKEEFAKLGRRNYDAALRGIAVRRLKKAGYSREEAESKLRLKRYALRTPTNFWNKLPALADQKLSKLCEFWVESST